MDIKHNVEAIRDKGAGELTKAKEAAGKMVSNKDKGAGELNKAKEAAGMMVSNKDKGAGELNKAKEAAAGMAAHNKGSVKVNKVRQVDIVENIKNSEAEVVIIKDHLSNQQRKQPNLNDKQKLHLLLLGLNLRLFQVRSLVES